MRTAALRFLGLKPAATDTRAHAVIRRWLERDDPRFDAYDDPIVESFEPITRERITVRRARYRRNASRHRSRSSRWPERNARHFNIRQHAAKLAEAGKPPLK
jgi:hypothetical protein